MSFWSSGDQLLVVCGPAQSNGPLEGRGTGTPTAVTAPRAYVHAFDGFVKPAADPVGSNTNNRYTTSSHASAANSYAPALLNALWSGGFYGSTDDIILCGFAEGGTSASTWSASAAAAPPVANTRFGIWELRMRDLLRNLPRPRLAFLIVDIGETDATNTTTAATWDSNMTTAVNAMITFLTSTMGLSWKKSLQIILRILPDLNATAFTAWKPPASPNIQDVEIAWAAARNATTPNSVITYKPTLTGYPTDMVASDNLHMQTNALNTVGTAIGNLACAAV